VLTVVALNRRIDILEEKVDQLLARSEAATSKRRFDQVSAMLAYF
jgi:hypothetical protein